VDPKAVEERWHQIEQTPFPEGHRGKSVQGQNLTLLESEAGGLVLTFVQTGGSFGARQLYHVRDVEVLFAKVVAELEGEGKEYFERIHKLLADIIQDLPEPGGR
jgi:hypothetical protein